MVMLADVHICTRTGGKQKIRHSPAYRFSPMPTLVLCESHALLDLLDSLARVQALGTSPTAVHNRMAPVQAHAVIQHSLPFFFMFITRIYQPAIALEEHGRAEVFFGVPPVRGAGGGAAGAKDAFVEPVQLLAIGWRHAVFFALGFLSAE